MTQKNEKSLRNFENSSQIYSVAVALIKARCPRLQKCWTSGIAKLP
jgi:hypothetical protein